MRDVLVIFRFLVLIPLLLAGCTSSYRTTSSKVVTIAAEHSSRTVNSFKFIGATTTLQDVTARLGPPDRDIGSGIYIYVYDLSDGSSVLIGSADGSRILFVSHGWDNLYQSR
jgi:hypothetical protein